ncbi:MAG: alpha/beta hydrolase [Parvibaculaceae bacterium]
MEGYSFLETVNGPRLAFFRHVPEPRIEARTGLLWLGGFRSDMTGTKAVALNEHAARTGRPYVRFDYSGHGASEGTFEACTLSDWTADAGRAFESLTQGPTVLVGSSMGGHIALSLYRRLAGADRARVAGLLLLAPAPDFTEDLLWAEAPEEGKRAILDEGRWLRPSAYGDPYPITRALIEDGRRERLLASDIDVACPVHILQGEDDPDVPVAHAMRLYGMLKGDDVRFTLIKGGDHRLSTPRDIATIFSAAEDLCVRADAAALQEAP